jgi:hypothetical protein
MAASRATPPAIMPASLPTVRDPVPGCDESSENDNAIAVTPPTTSKLEKTVSITGELTSVVHRTGGSGAIGPMGVLVTEIQEQPIPCVTKAIVTQARARDLHMGPLDYGSFPRSIRQESSTPLVHESCALRRSRHSAVVEYPWAAEKASGMAPAAMTAPAMVAPVL